jgi:hypothetical protein
MNGRIFDPTLGTFLQGDPMVQDPFNLQNYNRYAYCYNNPLTCTDPSGLFSFGSLLRDIVAVVVAIEAPELLGELMASAATSGGAFATLIGTEAGVGAVITPLGAFTSAAVGGFAAGAIASGNLKGGVEGAFTAGAFDLTGDFLSGTGAFSGGNYYGESGAVGITAHAVVGCVTTVASGGKCGPGALSAAFSQAALPLKAGDPLVATVESAVIGGTASVLGGGKFANGAETGAFGYLFNECGHTNMCGRLGGTPDAYSSSLQYPDGTLVVDPNTGKPYPVPSGFNMGSNLAFGENQPDATDIASQMRPGGAMDYQRPSGFWAAFNSHDVMPGYVDLGNYNYGTVMAAAGYTLEDSLRWAGTAKEI